MVSASPLEKLPHSASPPVGVAMPPEGTEP
ncbi:unnamed protein product [Protopolystoma xenopodis]|uniref:Uncharacterized protein n=1 Tax=Protopolystoma xenopodis TaxID=117903 RepID=A0A3S5A3E1_9PLAT|nr:unnamed protein product [Protopolystoma xenopodis]